MEMIISFILAIVSYMLIDNVVLSRFYGICSFIGVGNKVKSAFSMGLAVTFVIMMETLVCYPLYFFVLVPAGIPFLDTLVYILVIASLVQIVGLFIKKNSPTLYKTLGIYLPLITTNCAVLGVVQTNSDASLDFLTSLANGLGTSIGFLVVIVLFACMRERMNGYNIPKAMKGVPIALITAALMALAFMGFGGMVG